MIPEADRKYVSTEHENMIFYTDGSLVDTSKYTVEFHDDMVIIDADGTEFLFCTAESDITDYASCEVAILYSGKEFSSEPHSQSVVILNEKPEKNFLSEADYIDESVSFEFNKYGEIETKIIR